MLLRVDGDVFGIAVISLARTSSLFGNLQNILNCFTRGHRRNNNAERPFLGLRSCVEAFISDFQKGLNLFSKFINLRPESICSTTLSDEYFSQARTVEVSKLLGTGFVRRIF